MPEVSVSVIIPAYNQGHYLGEAIRSVLAQTYPDFEIIVVDDGSTDNTADVAKSYSDSRVRYIYQENRGLSGARNTGIRHATGSFLSYLDSDDLFLPEKLALLVNKFESEPELGLVAGQACLIDEKGQSLGLIFDEEIPRDPTLLLLHNPLHVGSVMVRRAWQECVGFFDETLRSYEDWDMWLRLARAGCKMGWVDQPVSQYRFHQAQMTRDGQQMTTATFAVLDKLYRNPAALPEKWRAMQDQAYSNAYLRAAYQSYRSQNYEEGKAYLTQAVELNPELTANRANILANRLVGSTNLPKVGDSLAFLESIYNNLPDGLADLRQRRRHDLGRAAIQLAFQSYQNGDLAQTRSTIRRAFYYQPGWLTNRGALAIFLRSHLSFLNWQHNDLT
jgi:hypothetical protein